MAKSSDDYESLGRQHASQRVDKHPYPKGGTSWQARAYWRGFNGPARQEVAIRAVTAMPFHGTETGRFSCAEVQRSNKPKSDISKLRVVDVDKLLHDTDWPQATWEHVRILAKQHNVEDFLPRRKRLHAALRRLTMRHRNLRKLTGLQYLGIVPMSLPELRGRAE